MLATHMICLLNGVEVEVTFVLAPSVLRVLKRLQAQGPELTEEEIALLGRIRTGWTVSERRAEIDLQSILRADRALDVYCATRNYVFAQKYLEKARKSATDGDSLTSIYLARTAVEQSYRSYFASRGFASLGAKWVQFLQAFDFGSPANRSLFRRCVALLFPVADMRGAGLDDYLAQVNDFLSSTRTAIEADPLHKIAFSACPQIYRL